MLEIRVGFVKQRVKRPRRMEGEEFSCRPLEKSTPRRKTTGSMREMAREFLCGSRPRIIEFKDKIQYQGPHRII
jgi:hypothetical protein